MVSSMFGLGHFLLLASAVAAVSTCPGANLAGAYKPPKVAAGYTARAIAKDLFVPRGLIFDSAGNLLVVQQGRGILALTLKDDGGACVTVASNKTVVEDSDITHGIELSADGKTLYASTVDNLYSYDYDAANTAATNNKTIVSGMTGSDHISRTLLLSKKAPGKMLISRGSTENVDLKSLDTASGISQIRVLDLSPKPQVYSSSGYLLGWGLRNSVGVAEHPITGGIWSVENSVDEMERLGVNIHENNPGEEINFHGYLNGTTAAYTGKNYGYPTCFSAWNVTEIPKNEGLKVGSNFAIGEQNATVNDKYCHDSTVPARLTLPSHWAPLDIKFNTAGNTAWITGHGSWNRDSPDGYNLFQIAFDPVSGQPLQPSDSTTHVIPVLEAAFLNDCPDACVRPVSLAWDTKGRLFFSNDMQGEIYIVTKSDGSGVDSVAAPANTTVLNARRRL